MDDLRPRDNYALFQKSEVHRLFVMPEYIFQGISELVNLWVHRLSSFPPLCRKAIDAAKKGETKMPKRKIQEFDSKGRPVRKSEFSEEREAYMDKNGDYVYCQWIPVGEGCWELRPTCSVKIGEDGVTSDITIILDDLDCEEDRQNNRSRKIRDKVFEEKCASYEKNPIDEKGDKKADPWEKEIYKATQGTSILDQFFPEKKSADPRMDKLLELMDELTEDQRNLIFDHLGQGKYFEQIAAEESERKGKHISRQAISNRWDRILTKLCRGFGVPKPVRRNDNKDED